MIVGKPSSSVSLSKTKGRATPPSGAQRARQGAKGFGHFLLRAVEGAASFVPGGSVATASLKAAGAGQKSFGGALKSAAGGVASQFETNTMEYDELLQTQMAMQKQNIEFSTMSNVLKSEHDTKKQIVTNYR